MATVLTLGSFDLPHAGHFHLFQQCKKIAGKDGHVAVGLNPDEFIFEFKKRLPIQSFQERHDILLGCKWIDTIYATPGADAKPLIEMVNPDYIVIGSDWAPPKNYHAQLQITQKYLSDRDITLLYLDRLGIWSSTELKERIREA